jgi:hypothetical protein
MDTVTLEERLLDALFNPEVSDEEPQEEVVSLSVGGHVAVQTGYDEAAEVGLFNEGIDGQVGALNEITTEPLRYERPPYLHEEGMEFDVRDSNGVVDSWFIELDGELVATGRIETARDLERIDSLYLEGPLLEFD